MTTIPATARSIAHERQLDWLLDEVLGGDAAARRAHAATTTRTPAIAKPFPWLAAAIALLAAGVAVGVAVLRGDDTRQQAQDPKPAPSPEPAPAEVPFVECHGAAELERLPADVTALRCFDFDDAACARLATFTKLERLDLSGTDVDEKGVSVPPRITDAGVRALAPLTGLRWLCLARSHAMQGPGLQALEAMPRLEHLDLTYSGVDTAAVERLARLPSLRTLVLSANLNFHGSALAAVATLPGLRRLELAGCPTLAAADVLPLAKQRSLRHLDLRDCQGRFRGQTLSNEGFDDFGAEATDDPEQGDPADLKDGVVKPAPPPKPPVQDNIGITDDVVAALAALPLETFLLGGSESLTDAIGPALATMTTLRTLGLGDLPKLTLAFYGNVPPQLTALDLDSRIDLTTAGAELRALPPLPDLRELGLSGIGNITDGDLERFTANKSLEVLHLGGWATVGKARPQPTGWRMTSAVATVLAKQTALRTLDLTNVKWVDASVTTQLGKLPRLRELNLTWSPTCDATVLAPLAASRSLRVLHLASCRKVDLDALRALRPLPLESLNLFDTSLSAADIEAAAKHWPGCTITMPDARVWRVPGR